LLEKPLPEPWHTGSWSIDNRDVIGIGGSMGAVEAVIRLARELPPDLPAAVLVTLHRGRDDAGLLAELLDSAGPMPACSPNSWTARGRCPRPWPRRASRSSVAGPGVSTFSPNPQVRARLSQFFEWWPA
jgi:hypothetical protein